jgi:hypothetical protein
VLEPIGYDHFIASLVRRRRKSRRIQLACRRAAFLARRMRALQAAVHMSLHQRRGTRGVA